MILLDVMMPGMTGFEVCQRIRNDPQITEIPIIILTALDDRDSLLNALKAARMILFPSHLIITNCAPACRRRQSLGILSKNLMDETLDISHTDLVLDLISYRIWNTRY